MTQTSQPETSLQRPILDRKGHRSYDRVSHDCGGVPSRNVIQKLATHETKAFPGPVTLTGLQRGLPAALDELLRACATSMKLTDGSLDARNLVIHGAGALSVSSQRVLFAMSEELQRLVKERDGSGSAAPMNRPAGDPGRNQHHEHDEKAPAAASAVGDELPADVFGLAAHRTTTPGMSQRVSVDEAGEESQVNPEGDNED